MFVPIYVSLLLLSADVCCVLFESYDDAAAAVYDEDILELEFYLFFTCLIFKFRSAEAEEGVSRSAMSMGTALSH